MKQSTIASIGVVGCLMGAVAGFFAHQYVAAFWAVAAAVWAFNVAYIQRHLGR